VEKAEGGDAGTGERAVTRKLSTTGAIIDAGQLPKGSCIRMSAPLGAEQAMTTPTDEFYPALQIAPFNRPHNSMLDELLIPGIDSLAL
jgi:hypothetical protein